MKMLNKGEEGSFLKVLLALQENPHEIYTLAFGNNKITATYDTCYEGDNGLDLTDERYEEFMFIVMKIQETGVLFEFNYQNMPDTVYQGNKKII